MNINLTLFGEAITFAIFIWFTMKFVWPLLLSAMQEREKKIADGLAAGKAGEESLVKAHQDIAIQLGEAKDKAAEIINKANQRALHITDAAKVQAGEEGDRLLTAAKAEIQGEVVKVKEELKSRVALLSVQGAEKILHCVIDKSKNDQLLNELVNSL